MKQLPPTEPQEGGQGPLRLLVGALADWLCWRSSEKVEALDASGGIRATKSMISASSTQLDEDGCQRQDEAVGEETKRDAGPGDSGSVSPAVLAWVWSTRGLLHQSPRPFHSRWEGRGGDDGGRKCAGCWASGLISCGGLGRAAAAQLCAFSPFFFWRGMSIVF